MRKIIVNLSLVFVLILSQDSVSITQTSSPASISPNSLPLTLFDSSGDLTYEINSQNQTIWIELDDDAQYVNITTYKDSIYLQEEMNFKIQTPYNVDVSGLAIGTYNYTFVSMDLDQYSLTTMIFVTVIPDTTAPIITGVKNGSVEIGYQGEICFDVYEPSSGNYTAYLNGTAFYIDSWISSERLANMSICPYIFSVYGLLNYTYVFEDEFGNSASTEVWITIIQDTTPPNITKVIGDLTLYYDNMNNPPPLNVAQTIFILEDNGPFSYVFSRNGTRSQWGYHGGGIPANILIDYFNLDQQGYFNRQNITLIFTIQVNDTAGFNITDQWVLHLVYVGLPEPPTISIYSTYTFQNGTYINFNLTLSSNYLDYYDVNITQNGVVIKQWLHAIALSDILTVIPVGYLDPGSYAIAIIAYDTYDQNTTFSQIFTVIAPAPPLIQCDVSYLVINNSSDLREIDIAFFAIKGSYQLYLDNQIIDQGSITFNSGLILPETYFENLTIGTHNFTIYAIGDIGRKMSYEITIQFNYNPNITTTPISTTTPTTTSRITSTASLTTTNSNPTSKSSETSQNAPSPFFQLNELFIEILFFILFSKTYLYTKRK